MTRSDATLSTTAKAVVLGSIVLLVLAALFLYDRTRYRPLDVRLDPERASEFFMLEPDPLVLVTSSSCSTDTGWISPNVLFALWPDGHGYFSDPAPTPAPKHFQFELSVADAAKLAEQLRELVRPGHGRGWSVEDSRDICVTVRDGSDVLSLAIVDGAYLPASIARLRSIHPRWPDDDPTLAGEPGDLLAVKTAIALEALLSTQTSALRAVATPVALSRSP